MFAHCQTFKELNDAYELAVAAVTSNQTFEQALADLAAGRTPAPDDRIPQWDAIKTAMQARWSELSGKPWPSQNTKERSDAFQQAARTLLEEADFDVRERVDYAAFVPLLVERTGCHSDTAKRHLAKAARLMRGEATAAWGGSRPGAGRPSERRDP